FRADAPALQLAKQVVETDAVAADDDEVGKLQAAAEKLHVDNRPGLHDLLVPADRREAIGAAERRDTAGALSHRICGKRSVPADRLNEPHEQVFGPADLAVHLHREPGGYHRLLLPTAAGEQPDH